MFFWPTIAIFLLVDISVFLYIYKHRIQFPKASACKKGVCGYWELPKCTNPNVDAAAFESRNGRTELYPCSSVSLGFESAGEHARHIRSSIFSNSIVVLGFILSFLALEVSILIHTRSTSLIEERITTIEAKVANLDQIEDRITTTETSVKQLERTDDRITNIETRIDDIEKADERQKF